MANMPDDKWVDDQLNTLKAPDGPLPDLAGARAHLDALAARAARKTRTTWVVALAALVALVALPWPRAVAQQIWDRLFVNRVEVIQVESEGLPADLVGSLLFAPGSGGEVDTREVSGPAEAETLAGFRPMLPAPGVLTGEPRLAILQKLNLTTQPIRIADLERALASVGAWDVTVPREWEGVTLTAEGGPMIAAAYENAELMQTPSFRIVMPPGFDFAHLMEVTFRIFGRPAEEARRLASKFAANPALLLHFPETDPVEDIGLDSGYGIFVGDPNRTDGICFFWNRPDRLFIVAADTMSVETATAIANSIGN